MYREGLGDRFLLRLPQPERPFYMLIDCGVLEDSGRSREQMRRVARDIAEETDGHLDVVVVTHAHWDHFSGFLQARETFDAMAIDEIWLPWTEDAADASTQRLFGERLRVLGNLRVAANRLEESDGAACERIRGVLDLMGPSPTRDARRAIESLLAHPGRPRVRFLGACDAPLALGHRDGPSAYVLGPRRPGPEAAARDDAYDHAAGRLFFAAIGHPPVEATAAVDLDRTFAPRYRRSPDEMKRSDFMRDHYLRGRDDWRRIDATWLFTAEPFALALSRRTSDSSLVLAIELEPAGRVLLFPGDAQAASWRDWSAVRWRVGSPPGRVVTANDLLSRTVLYKASHHGSITGTPLDDGLCRMTSPDLIVMVSVDGEAAMSLHWDLPSTAMVEHATQRARGRVVRSDLGVSDRPDQVSPATWDAFLRNMRDDDGLFLEYILAS
jgi:beta-lactamase superfamily II metal-dependent hydrolase